MRSCRNCRFSKHSSDKLLCQITTSPAYSNNAHGVCSVASRSLSENLGYDVRCRVLADICLEFEADTAPATWPRATARNARHGHDGAHSADSGESEHGPT